MNLINELVMKGFIEEAKKGKIFSVDFVKKDGTVRTMNARLGVKKGLTGEGMKYDPLKRGLLPVYDMQKRDYRMINFKSLLSIRMKGQKWKIV